MNRKGVLLLGQRETESLDSRTEAKLTDGGQVASVTNGESDNGGDPSQ
jgi:hypothetical protein